MKATTIEQSLRLIELGLKKTSSDLYYYKGHRDELEVIVKHENLDDEDIVAWSLDALLNVMPKRVKYNGNDYILRLQYEEGGAPFMYYVVAKGEIKGRLIRFNNGHCVPDAYDALDAAHQMVCWLLDDGYIKKEKDNG